MTKLKLIATVLLFLAILSGARLLWTMNYMQADQTYAVQGELDLREGIPENHTITLDGEWAFYPETWLFREDIPVTDPVLEFPSPQSYILVPSKWNAALQPDRPTPYGYGTYRLRIFVDPNHEDKRFSIRVPSVRSSSQVFVNGRLLSQSGVPAESIEQYSASNVPVTVTFNAERSGVIDIVIQVSNFKDSRGGGVIRSLTFGTEDNVKREMGISSAMQYLISIVILLHAIYASMLYFMGTRELKLLYFSLTLFVVTFAILLSTEDKLLLNLIPINYDWSFRVMSMGLILIVFLLLKCAQHMSILPVYWHTRIIPAFTLFSGAAILYVLVTPLQYIQFGPNLYTLMAIPIIIIEVIYLLRSQLKGNKENIYIVLAVMALANHYLWVLIFVFTGIKVLFYPFDLLVALIACTSIWFKGYFRTFAETKDLAAKLQRTNQYKDQFLANTSHELRNPLHGILNISQAVLERERASLAEKSIMDLTLVQTVGRRMSHMLNDLIDASMLREGNIQLQNRSLLIQPVISSTIGMIRFMTEGKPIRLTYEIAPDFPPVLADENRLTQILFNLLHNAVKYTNEGEVSVHGEIRNNRAYISIQDTGIGIDHDTLKRIFDPYEQGSHDNRIVESGFGLGLSISKQLVELHGGELQVSSIPGEGSIFTFSITLSDLTALKEDSFPLLSHTIHSEPIETSKEYAAAAHSYTPSTEAMLDITDKPRILAVDDETINLMVLESILSTEPYSIVTVSSAEEALDLLHAQKWDLLISDVVMPRMSGYELTQAIRERYSITELPVLLLTARSHPSNVEFGFQCGANDYVTKPVDAIELRARVRALTAVKQSAHERLRMEAAWLQAQIEPHFLFNTLNSISALSEFDVVKMRELIEVFGGFLQEKYRFQNTDSLVPLAYEIELVHSYLFIEQLRFEERIQVVWEMDEHIELTLPPLTIQPLVENAVKHGILKRARGGTITIRILDYFDYVEISVSDDGVGMDQAMLASLFEHKTSNDRGIALRNIELRLNRIYGSGLHFESTPEHGTTITFKARKHL
jgi:two-component system sensor histidine kinase ChiS